MTENNVVAFTPKKRPNWSIIECANCLEGKEPDIRRGKTLEFSVTRLHPELGTVQLGDYIFFEDSNYQLVRHTPYEITHIEYDDDDGDYFITAKPLSIL